MIESTTPARAAARDAALVWTWARFDALDAPALYQALRLRAQVFVVEQACVYLDPDGLDVHAWHLLGRDANGTLIAYLRVVDPGCKFAEPSIGRVVTAPEARAAGVGRQLMQEGVRRCIAAWPGRDIRIGAQAHLQRFYRALGFDTVSEPFDEDGIPHVEMLWRAR